MNMSMNALLEFESHLTPMIMVSHHSSIKDWIHRIYC